ncbi:subtilisin-like protease SBT5.4 [Impatiens glandulifera]|uniref:subtilisin-like protease SBT5.4 n=1 Tax=Impatiens glandulifera TaxID=253017 RepID=UPI001FB10956|nr:subtilisin-like protease SBT5.4 [Impatiens glandulifera]
MGSHKHELHEAAQFKESIHTSHSEFLSSFLSREENANDEIIYSYTNEINGFAARLDENQAAAIEKHPNVVSVVLNKPLQLHTTRSWEFLFGGKVSTSSLPSSPLWTKKILIFSITGVWPESKSFSDDAYGPVPSRWKGSCQNDTLIGVPCNNKLIGAKFYNKGIISSGEKISPNLNSARDFVGHGTHTLSTAGGNFVAGADVFGVGNGTTKGGSPRARVAAYKACWEKGCSDPDMMAAMDAAIHDGADIISLSLGGALRPYMDDTIAISSFHAIKKGIVVVCSAGNSGPSLGTVANVAPWILTVGANTIDREFETTVKLGDGRVFQGTSLTRGLSNYKLYPIISGDQAAVTGVSTSDALLCLNGTLDVTKVKGKIVACVRGTNGRVGKGLEIIEAGGIGMVLCNSETDGNDVISDLHVIPTSHVNYTTGLSILKYINSTANPTAYISSAKTVIGTKPAPTMASFSSRGPNLVTPEILKPDITAPGVNILASFSEGTSPAEIESDPRRSPFATQSGTSMSCPHISGIAALIKKVHPDWSPAAIKSAIMTTARIRDNTGKPMLDYDGQKATPFSYGAGQVRPNRAINPGLVYDLTINDHLDFLCAIGYKEKDVQLVSGTPYKCPKNVNSLNYNYPSISIPNLTKPTKVTRTLKNVGQPGVYTARVRGPPGVLVTVEPTTLKFEKAGEEKSFTMSLGKINGANITLDFVFGELLWTDGKHNVRSPISVGFHDLQYLTNQQATTGIFDKKMI